jgi:hypothetical protein
LLKSTSHSIVINLFKIKQGLPLNCRINSLRVTLCLFIYMLVYCANILSRTVITSALVDLASELKVFAPAPSIMPSSFISVAAPFAQIGMHLSSAKPCDFCIWTKRTIYIAFNNAGLCRLRDGLLCPSWNFRQVYELKAFVSTCSCPVSGYIALIHFYIRRRVNSQYRKFRKVVHLHRDLIAVSDAPNFHPFLLRFVIVENSCPLIVLMLVGSKVKVRLTGLLKFSGIDLLIRNRMAWVERRFIL